MKCIASLLAKKTILRDGNEKRGATFSGKDLPSHYRLQITVFLFFISPLGEIN